MSIKELKNEIIIDDSKIYLDKLKNANACSVRNLFEKLLAAQANRIVNIKNISLEDFKMLTVEEFESV